MANESASSPHRFASLALQKRTALKTFLSAVMGLLSVLVFGLAVLRKNVLWLWIGFICALVAGIFVQMLINREPGAPS